MPDLVTAPPYPIAACPTMLRLLRLDSCLVIPVHWFARYLCKTLPVKKKSWQRRGGGACWYRSTGATAVDCCGGMGWPSRPVQRGAWALSMQAQQQTQAERSATEVGSLVWKMLAAAGRWRHTGSEAPVPPL